MESGVGEIGLNKLMVLLSNPALGIVGILLIVLAGYGFAYPAWRWIIVALMVFLGSLAPAIDFFGTWIRPPFPFDHLVLYAQVINVVLLTTGAAVLGFQFLQKPHTCVAPASVAILATQWFAHARLAGSHSPLDGFQRAAIALLVFMLVPLLLTSAVRSVTDLRRYVMIIPVAGLVYVISTVIVKVLDPQGLMENGRFSGLSGNPNHVAITSAVMLPAVLGMATWKLNPHRQRIVWASVAAVMIVLLLMSGSRGGLLTAAAGVLVLYWRRLGRMIFVAVPVVLLVFLLWSWFQGDPQNLERLMSTEDTRSATYLYHFEQFLNHPLFGVGGDMRGYVENAYLAIAVHGGLIGCIPLFIFLGLCFRQAIQNITHRKMLGEYSVISDIAVAGVAAILTNGMVEALLMATMSHSIFMLYLYLSLGKLVTTLQGPVASAHPLASPIVFQGSLHRA